MPTIEEDCYCVHEFEWELVDSGQYDFRGPRMSIQKEISMQMYFWNPNGSGLSVDRVQWFNSDFDQWYGMTKREWPESGGSLATVFSEQLDFKMNSRIAFRIESSICHLNGSLA